ncbi:hypothetical protein SEVIR_9G284700v4 [Setaria viridis]|uniref:Uncharacterized protein n=1 Tax=Setaria viridis TaxID=4556 RepID=A0A4U6SYQ5_SETVI|nr:hypothetical protein SEVIR_9G284700v2 [Setaria viridis]TKV94296.1 hypothetical protein SEVIR_9G284700v2 [Setaria viridis]TKV94297.1 hypothetical protein SEVIR_9G284700v2 [Setaria viridis]TKV94298.1 hypothetical protein SEVIR_9G284700v2 [Setaria viridis]
MSGAILLLDGPLPVWWQREEPPKSVVGWRPPFPGCSAWGIQRRRRALGPSSCIQRRRQPPLTGWHAAWHLTAMWPLVSTSHRDQGSQLLLQIVRSFILSSYIWPCGAQLRGLCRSVAAADVPGG